MVVKQTKKEKRIRLAGKKEVRKVSRGSSYLLPLIGEWVVSFNDIQVGLPVKPANNEESVAHDGDAHGIPARAHRRHRCPAVSHGIVPAWKRTELELSTLRNSCQNSRPFNAIETGGGGIGCRGIMPSESVQESVSYRDADSATALGHWGHHGPSISMGIVALDGPETGTSIPSADSVSIVNIDRFHHYYLHRSI